MSLSVLFVGQNSRNDMDEGWWKEKREKKNCITCWRKGPAEAAITAAARGEKAEKKRGGQVRIFIHIHSKWHSSQKLHIYFSFLHRCTVVLLWMAQVTFFMNRFLLQHKSEHTLYFWDGNISCFNSKYQSVVDKLRLYRPKVEPQPECLATVYGFVH